jgi:hypothetical protein
VRRTGKVDMTVMLRRKGREEKRRAENARVGHGMVSDPVLKRCVCLGRMEKKGMEPKGDIYTMGKYAR